MVIITKESNARKIFKAYDEVVAFSLGKAKGNKDDVNISYEQLLFMPDQDVINGIIAGDVSGKKVIKKAVKMIYSPDKKDNNIALYMTQLINMQNNRSKKSAPNVMVFVLDEPEDKVQAKTNKFLTKYVSSLFEVFGIEPVTDDNFSKYYKKVFKHKVSLDKDEKKEAKRKAAKKMGYKDEKKTAKKIKDADERAKALAALDKELEDRIDARKDAMKLRKSAHAVYKELLKLNAKKGFRLSNDGQVWFNTLLTFYRVEITQQSLTHISIEDIGRNQRRNLVKRMADIASNNNLKIIVDLGYKPKDQETLMKKLRDKNTRICKYYNELRQMLVDEMGVNGKKLPKVPTSKKKDKKFKKIAKKFFKFFDKSKNNIVITMMYAHCTLRAIGVDIGSSEYNRIMNGVTSQESDEFAKTFKAAAKNFAKNLATEE